MDRLFHIFVSSTYSDLVEERRRVSEALSKAGHVPEGMEIFPASSQKQFDFIKRVIDRCDYYIVVVAGRYGSMASEEVSFTELEYKYAVSAGLPTLAFLHSDPSQLEVVRAEADPKKSEKLARFRERLEKDSLVDYWSNPDQLATKVVAAVAQEVSSNPGIGWIRGDKVANEEVLRDLNALRKENEALTAALAAAQPPLKVENLAGMDDKFTIHYKYKLSRDTTLYRSDEIEMSWRDILRVVGPEFRTISNTSGIDKGLSRYFRDELGKSHRSLTFSMTDQERILTQMELLGFMKAEVYQLKGGGRAVFHQLTPAGVREVLRLNAVTTE